MQCESCQTQLIPVLKTRKSIATELTAAIILIVGLVITAIESIAGGLTICALSFILSTINKEIFTQMKCPSCGKEGLKL